MHELIRVEALDPLQHPAAVFAARKSRGSRAAIANSIKTIAEILAPGVDPVQFNWAALRYVHAAALQSELCSQLNADGTRRFKFTTVKRHMATLRGVLKTAWLLGQITQEDYAQVCAIEPPIGSSLPAGRALARSEILAIFRICQADTTPAGARDAAIVGVLYGALLRRAELVALTLSDYEEHGWLHVRHGKRDKERRSCLPRGGVQALDAWLRVRGADPGPLFCPITQSGALAPRTMTPGAVRLILLKRAAQAGVAHFTPHDLRRTGISDLLDAGADISAVGDQAGQDDPATTKRYDRRGDRAKRQAVELLHVPYEEK